MVRPSYVKNMAARRQRTVLLPIVILAAMHRRYYEARPCEHDLEKPALLSFVQC